MSAPGRAVLWAVVVAGPLLWTLHELVLYPLTSQACFGLPPGEGPGPWPNVAVGAGTLLAAALTAAALLGAVRARRRMARAGDPGDPGVPIGPVAERRRFMAEAGILLGVLFLYGILMAGLPALLVPPCG